MGRGAARREFKAFRVDLADSREMFDEAAEIIMRGLETGIVEADTKWYKQPRVEVRPRPLKSFKDRTVMVSMSPSSVEAAARFGIQSLRFSQGDWKRALPEINAYRDLFKQCHGRAAPPFIVNDFMVCFELVGQYDMLANFSFGGMPYDLVYEQAKRFADKIMPKLKG